MSSRGLPRCRSALPIKGRGFCLSLFLILAACRAEPAGDTFPEAGRDVAPIVADAFSTEDARDRVGEAEEVMRLAQIGPGQSVADIGAGEGYTTVRLSPVVGRRGRVLAGDIDPQVIERLAQRVQHDGLDNVSVRLGTPEDPRLPRASFDRILLVHMYHEVTSPYAFLWHLREGLKPDGDIVVVDADREVKHHGIPPARLACEFAALGLEPFMHASLSGGDAYLTRFRIARPRPAPSEIEPCRLKD